MEASSFEIIPPDGLDPRFASPKDVAIVLAKHQDRDYGQGLEQCRNEELSYDGADERHEQLSRATPDVGVVGDPHHVGREHGVNPKLVSEEAGNGDASEEVEEVMEVVQMMGATRRETVVEAIEDVSRDRSDPDMADVCVGEERVLGLAG
ncbi:hypothetical protein ACLOJK_005728 [Asimina triloba]